MAADFWRSLISSNCEKGDHYELTYENAIKIILVSFNSIGFKIETGSSKGNFAILLIVSINGLQQLSRENPNQLLAIALWVLATNISLHVSMNIKCALNRSLCILVFSWNKLADSIIFHNIYCTKSFGVSKSIIAASTVDIFEYQNMK